MTASPIHICESEHSEKDGSDRDTSESDSESDTMSETEKAQEDATLTTYQKMATFMTLRKDEAKSSLGSHKLLLGRTRAAADKAVKVVEDLPCVKTIKNMERCMEAYDAKADAMELAYKHLFFLDPAESKRWEVMNERDNEGTLATHHGSGNLTPEPSPVTLEHRR